MDTFDKAFEHFKLTCSFVLNDCSLTFSQLIQLKRYLEYLKLNFFEIDQFEKFPKLQIHLSNVSFVLDQQEHTLTGAITESEHTLTYNESFPDFHILSLITKSQNQVSLRVTDERKDLNSAPITFETGLLAVLCQDKIWHTIKLYKLKHLTPKGEAEDLSTEFFSQLFIWLAKDSIILKCLGFTAPSYLNQEKFRTFLIRNKSVDVLHLELNDCYNWVASSMFYRLSLNPNLKLLDLRGSRLDISLYENLSTLLDRNYHIKILLPEPKAVVVLKEFNEIIERISKPGSVRFVEEQLTQTKLINLAVDALEDGKKNCIKCLINIHDELSGITTYNDVKEACNALPEVYSENANLVKQNASYFKLDLRKLLEPPKPKTVGYYLLEKAFAVEDGESIVCLLNAGANLLEHSDINTLVSSLIVDFEDSNYPNWKKTIIKFLQTDLSILVFSTIQIVPSKSGYSPIEQLKNLLNQYLIKLKERIGFVHLLNSIHEIWIRLESIESRRTRVCKFYDTVSNQKNDDINYEKMNLLHDWVISLVVNSSLARRCWLNYYKLNDDELRPLGLKLQNEVSECLTQLHAKQVAEIIQKASEEIDELKQSKLLAEVHYHKAKEDFEERAKVREEAIKTTMDYNFFCYEQKLDKLSQAVKSIKNSLASNGKQLTKHVLEESADQKEEIIPFFKR